MTEQDENLRIAIATMAMHALMLRSGTPADVAVIATSYADALLAELAKPK